MAALYDYLFVTLARVPTPHQALATTLSRAGAGEVVGLFAPQLGWAANEAAVLMRWPGERGDLAAELAPSLVQAVDRTPLAATVRPASDDATPRPGGIYVHRWFEVEAGDADEFVALSQQGWRDFEARFDADIFGLFRSEAERDETAPGPARLLLITRYADHGVWEASRDPSTEAMRIFMRRQQLTRRTWAASTRLVGP